MCAWPRSAAAVERAARIAGPEATVRAIGALAGGTHARTWLIETANPRLEVVLREFPAGDDAACREARVLMALDGLDGLAPRLLAVGAAGSPSGESWVLISRLRGAADLAACPPSAIAEQLGETLARIHATALPRLAGFDSVFERPGGSAAAVGGPAAGRVAAGWASLVAAPRVLTHYDFWSGNVVWDGAVLTGVVDWTGAAVGPAGFDVGWCRLDLYLLYDQRTAEVFLDSYQAASGSVLADRALWDLWAVARSHADVGTWTANYRDLGRGDLTATELRNRHAGWTERLLASR